MAKTPSRRNQQSVRMIDDREAASSTGSVGPDPPSTDSTSNGTSPSQETTSEEAGKDDFAHAELRERKNDETASTRAESHHGRVREAISDSEDHRTELGEDDEPEGPRTTVEENGVLPGQAEEIDADSSSATSRYRLTRRVTTTLALGVVLVVLTGAGAVWTGVAWVHGVRTDSARDEALVAARDEAAALTSVDFRHPDQDVGKVLNNATGGFAKLFQQNRDSYTKIVKDGQVVSTGEVVGAGVETADEHSARILLAVQSRVQNKQAPNGESRAYRMVATMEKQPDRTWRVAGMEFLP